MPPFLKRQAVRYPLYILIVIVLATIGVLAFHNKILAGLALILFAVVFFVIFRMERRLIHEAENFVINFSQRFSEVSEEAIATLPIGVVLYTEDLKVEWANEFMTNAFDKKVEMGQPLSEISEHLASYIWKKTENNLITIDHQIYKIEHKKTQRLIYFTNVTDQRKLEREYLGEKTVICLLFLDNYDDVTQGMDDQKRSKIRNLVTSEITDWASENELLVRRVSSDRFIAVLNDKILERLEKSKFNILDDVRVATMRENVPLTLSIGVGSGVDSLTELGVLAQSSLDLALGRGGDQAVIKMQNGKAKFYGGKTNPTGKRTRVRARVISHALRDLIVDSANVIIMGHRNPDMDVYGSAIGLLRVAEVNEVSGYVVVDKNEMDSSLKNLFAEIKKNEPLHNKFVSADRALELASEKSLLIVIDTHKPSLVIEEKLLKAVGKIVVIDHHRRGEEVIENPILSYMEPYASSTAELVAELMDYHPNLKKLDIFEATALLAGIVVDTKSFTLRTGSRTFDAASFLRFHGANLAQIQNIFKEDVDEVVERNKLLETVYFYKDGIAIAKGDNAKVYSQVQIAKAADTLLTMGNVEASIVLARKGEDSVAVSSRSLGEINVQLIMEEMDGGGHFTNAATQQSGVSVDEVEKRLHLAIENYFEGRIQE